MKYFKSLLIMLFGITESTSKTELLINALPENIRKSIEDKILEVQGFAKLTGKDKQSRVVYYIEKQVLHTLPSGSKAVSILNKIDKHQRKHLINAVVAVLFQKIIDE